MVISGSKQNIAGGYNHTAPLIKLRMLTHIFLQCDWHMIQTAITLNSRRLFLPSMRVVVNAGGRAVNI